MSMSVSVIIGAAIMRECECVYVHACVCECVYVRVSVRVRVCACTCVSVCVNALVHSVCDFLHVIRAFVRSCVRVMEFSKLSNASYSLEKWDRTTGSVGKQKQRCVSTRS
jgi:hypothetical protein